MMNFIKINIAFFLLAGISVISIACSKKTIDNVDSSTNTGTTNQKKSDVAMWLTKADQSFLFQKLNVSLDFSIITNSNPSIVVDSTTSYQTIDGFGYCLTGGSASLINSLGSAQQDALLKELFLTDSLDIGVSYIRISIGASDLSADDFTYDDIPSGQTDTNLNSFSLGEDSAALIPVLKKIIQLDPNIKIIATPWTAPVWMKINTLGSGGFRGGHLNTAFYNAYAAYFVKYIQAMKSQGINIGAITPQNEPLTGNNNPAMVMEPIEETNFIKNSLGPAFRSAGLTTKIIVYDHNPDSTNYPLAVLSDPAANSFVDGSAFHLYAGSINALTPVHMAYPDKNVYFTEEYTSSNGNFSADLSWHVDNLIIGATQNWCRNVLEWNLATDAYFGPHTDGGCTTCLGALTISGSNITRNVSYYIIAHASKFVRPGAVRISSTSVAGLANVAFKNTDGSKVLIVSNSSVDIKTFNISFNGKTVSSVLTGGAVATYIWK